MTTVNACQLARKNTRLTQESAAEALFIHTRTLQDYESGKRQPPPDVCARMSKLYGVSLGALDNPAAVCMDLSIRHESLGSMWPEMREITRDGMITPDEKPAWDRIVKEAQEMAVVCAAMTQLPVVGS